MSAPFEWRGAGFYPDLEADAYHADPAPEPSFSAGMAETLNEATPLHLYTESKRLNPEWSEPDRKEAFETGKAAHSFITGRGAPILEVDADSWRTKDAKAQREKATEMGYTPLLTDQAASVRRMVQAARLQLRAHPEIGYDPFEEAEPEVAAFWQRHAVWNRIMVDGLDRKRRIAWDLKTHSGLADPKAWARNGLRFGVHVRAAHYLEGLEELGGGGWRYRFVVVETSPPHGLSVLELSETALEMGRRAHAQARDLYRECLQRGVWPCWPGKIDTVEMPAWMVEQQMTREIEAEDRRARTPNRSLIDAAIRFQAP